jgi:hypothetical protein
LLELGGVYARLCRSSFLEAGEAVETTKTRRHEE